MLIRFGLIVALSVLLSVSLVSFGFADTGCRRDCEPPTLGVLYTGQKVVEKGFTINDKSFDVSERTQVLPTTAVRTGQNVNVKLVAYENSGAEYLREVSLAIGNFEDDKHQNVLATMYFKQPFTALVGHPLTSGSDVSQLTSVDDPTGLLKDVTITASRIDSYRTAITISFQIIKPLETSDIIIQTQDAKKETTYNVFYDAIKATGKDMTPKPVPPTKTPPPPPLKQLQNKTPLSKVECRAGFEKVTRTNGAVACVSTYTAEMLRSMGHAS